MSTTLNTQGFRHPKKTSSSQPCLSTQGAPSQCFIPFVSTALGNLLCHQLLCLSLGLFSLSSYQMLLQVMFTRLGTATSSQPSDKYNFICHNEAWTSWLTFGARPFVSEMISFNFEESWWCFYFLLAAGNLSYTWLMLTFLLTTVAFAVACYEDELVEKFIWLSSSTLWPMLIFRWFKYLLLSFITAWLNSKTERVEKVYEPPRPSFS